MYADAPRKDWLRVYARSFRAVEVNATFYRLLPRTTFTRWRDETPALFRFCIKGSRFLTHNTDFYTAFGLGPSSHGALVVFGLWFGLLAFLLHPITSAISRR